MFVFVDGIICLRDVKTHITMFFCSLCSMDVVVPPPSLPHAMMSQEPCVGGLFNSEGEHSLFYYLFDASSDMILNFEKGGFGEETGEH